MKYHIAKGVFDILPKDPDPEGKWRESYLWHYLEEKVRSIAPSYGFQEIRTPLFEHTDLFNRGVGAGTDIVSKEMYTFCDRANRQLSLRPEGTAPVMRAFIEKRLDQLSPIHKFYYLYPMFRYERQQAGRYRQHHQFGVEAIGHESPLQDVEVIDLLFSFLKDLGLKGLTLELNSIGNEETRIQFKEELKDFLRPHLNELSTESRERFEINPLRILDSKDAQDKEILKKAPSILDFLDESSKEHFQEVCHSLDALSIPYHLNPFLVRGLDYYNRTVFEITAKELGAQNSLGGGGRYDGLMKKLGGPDLPAIGFGAGLERILQTLLAQQATLPKRPTTLCFFIPLGEEGKKKCFQFTCELRKHFLPIEMDFSGKKLKQALRYADTIQAQYVAIIGDAELATSSLELKHMADGKREQVLFEELTKRLLN